MMTLQAGLIAMATVVLLPSIAIPAAAQSPTPRIEQIKAAEALVHVGVFHAGSDEGGIGTATSFGGTVTVPLTWRLAAEFDLQTSRVSRLMGLPDAAYETRRTLLIPSLLYRFGRASIYGYIGGGIGAEFDRSSYIGAGIPNEEQFNVNRTLSFRGGVAGFPAGRFGVRADVYTAGWHSGARVGVAYRFR